MRMGMRILILREWEWEWDCGFQVKSNWPLQKFILTTTQIIVLQEYQILKTRSNLWSRRKSVRKTFDVHHNLLNFSHADSYFNENRLWWKSHFFLTDPLLLHIFDRDLRIWYFCKTIICRMVKMNFWRGRVDLTWNPHSNENADSKLSQIDLSGNSF